MIINHKMNLVIWCTWCIWCIFIYKLYLMRNTCYAFQSKCLSFQIVWITCNSSHVGPRGSNKHARLMSKVTCVHDFLLSIRIIEYLYFPKKKKMVLGNAIALFITECTFQWPCINSVSRSKKIRIRWLQLHQKRSIAMWTPPVGNDYMTECHTNKTLSRHHPWWNVFAPRNRSGSGLESSVLWVSSILRY